MLASGPSRPASVRPAPLCAVTRSAQSLVPGPCPPESTFWRLYEFHGLTVPRRSLRRSRRPAGVTEGVGVLRPLQSQMGPEDGTNFHFLRSGGRVNHEGVAGPRPFQRPREGRPASSAGAQAASLTSLPVLMRLLRARLRPCPGL